MDAEGCVTLVRQLREATRKRLLELPAGTAEPGEEPLGNGELVWLHKVGHGFSVPKNWMPQFKDGFAKVTGQTRSKDR